MNQTLKQNILDVADEEKIVAIKITGPCRSDDRAEKYIKAEHLENKVLPWDEVAPFLDYLYGSGHGGQDCHTILAWTKTKVIYTHDYDWSTTVTYLPRNPN